MREKDVAFLASVVHTFFVMKIDEAVAELEKIPYFSSEIDCNSAFSYLHGSIGGHIKYGSKVDSNGNLTVSVKDLIDMVKRASDYGRVKHGR